MSSASNLAVPMVLWGRHAPTHCISAILMTPDMKNIITGCNDGQICIWDLNDNWQLYPRSMLFGHTTAISCLTLGSDHPQASYVVSSSENGEMCLWDITDGRCIENTKMTIVHTDINAYRFRTSKELRLVCNGYYPEIHVINPLSFEILWSLCSKLAPDWISACCVLRPVKRDDDVVLAVTNSGTVKVWILNSEPKTKHMYEDESKQIRCLNAQTLTCCPYNQRTVLIVCSKYWQVYNYNPQSESPRHHGNRIYDAGDFTLLCSESNRVGERWAGGDFISVDRVIVWSNDGKGYLYKLPTNANPETQDYHRQHQSTSPHAYYILDLYADQSLVCSPAMMFYRSEGENATKRLLLRGDSEGRVVIWKLPEVSERQMTLVRQESFDRLPALPPRCKTTLQDVWDNLYRPPAGVLDGLCDENSQSLHISSTIYIPSQGKLVCGRINGTIVIVPATQSVMLQLLTTKTLNPGNIPTKILQGHDGRVTCLLYPFNESTRYEPQHLLSGGADFSVILWDMNSGYKIHTFTVHGGELNQMLVPPGNCNTRILSSICSVASDHSVALLSLKERKCIMLAGRHLFPVQTIRWRPLDDFMVVSCTDGTVYVWQMETGHLDRVVHGITAEEILNNCDENAIPMESLTNPSLTLAQALKRRNLATFKNLAQQKLQQQQAAQQQAAARPPPVEMLKPAGYPLLIQGVRTNTRDPDSHVLFFDTEALIVQLLTEEYAMMSPGELEARGLIGMTEDQLMQSSEMSETQQKLMGFIAKAKEKAENVGQKIQAKAETAGLVPSQPGQAGGRSTPTKMITSQSSPRMASRPDGIAVNDNLTLEIAQFFMSCLHAWGLDPDLDRLCINKLGLLKPQCPISFGLLSRQGHMSLMLPGWHKRVCQEELVGISGDVATKSTLADQVRTAAMKGMDKGTADESSKKTLLAQRSGSVPFDVEHLLFCDVEAEGDPSVSGSVVETKPLPKIPESALQEETRIFSAKARWKISSGVTTQHLLSVISTANTLMSMSHASFIFGKQSRSRRKRTKSTFSNHQGIIVSETDSDQGSEDEDSASILQAQIKQGWSLLAALHCVLLPELVGAAHYQPPQLEMLARRWQDRCLEIREAAQALLLAELRRIGPEGRKSIIDEWAPYLPTYVDPQHSLLSDSQRGGEEDDDEEDDEQMLAGDSPAHKVSVSFESRRKQATAIVMLGVIGAEFGHEIEPNRRKVEEPKKNRRNIQEGFSLTNYNLSRHTSKALTFLLLTPPSPRLPAHTPIRRAAIDLLGRGFTVWEPYLDVSSVLLGLLELCVDADKLLPSMTYGLPLTPAADACRSARHALSLIATARPPALIITMAKEVARYNAMAQNAQSQHAQLANSVLVRARHEILHMIELLVEKMPNDVADLICEVIDVTLHCLEVSQLKAKGLQELFPAICRFSMVSYCSQTKRIWAGAKNGGLALYEMKQHGKCQMIPAHHGPIIAISVNPDGKFLATFSHVDSKLKFWQTASSTLFGIGSQQTKCVRQYSTVQLHVTPLTNLLKLVRLVWIDNRTVVLLTVDGTETKYSV